MFKRRIKMFFFFGIIFKLETTVLHYTSETQRPLMVKCLQIIDITHTRIIHTKISK